MGGNEENVSVLVAVLAYMVNDTLCRLHGLGDFLDRSYHFYHLIMGDVEIMQCTCQHILELIAERPDSGLNCPEMIF